MSLWVPPTVSRELMEARQQRETVALLHAHTTAVCDDFNDELRRIDPGLSMVFLPEPMPLDVVAAGGRPGRYNIIREGSRGGPLAFMPIVGPNDEFIEPTSRVFDMLREMDWWNPGVRQARRERDGRIEDARRKREVEERERINMEVLERFKAVTETSVSMNRSTPWSQNASATGRRGAKS